MKFAPLLFFSGLFLIFLIAPTDPDLGWHLRCGQEFWEKHTFCNQNSFSVLLNNYSWPNNYWLYQAIIFPIYKSFGLWGLTILNSLILTFSFLFLYLAIKNWPILKMIAITIIIFFSWGVLNLGVRSQLPGLLFFNALLYLSLIFAPLIMLLWANTHGSFILGLILLSFSLLKDLFYSPKHQYLPIKPLLLSLIAYLLSFAATFLNPFGFAIYDNSWRHIGVVDLSKLIAEWVPPNPNIIFIIVFLSLALFLYLIIFKRLEAFFLLPFIYLALKARRNLPFFFIMFFYLFLTAPPTKKLLHRFIQFKIIRYPLALAVLFSLFYFGLFINFPSTLKINRSWQNYCQFSYVGYPCQAIAFLKKQPSKGHIFNRYEWGGFLIWQLPEYKIFVDGRMPAWPTPEDKSPYTIYLETLQTQPGWNETLKEYNINWIFISPGTFMDLKLKDNPQEFGWQEVFRDEISVIYKSI